MANKNIRLPWEERGKTVVNSVKLGKVSLISTQLNLETVYSCFFFVSGSSQSDSFAHRLLGKHRENSSEHEPSKSRRTRTEPVTQAGGETEI